MIQCANGRGEELKENPSYRDAWKRGQRCLVPATGFFESHTIASATGKGKGESIPYFIHLQDEPIFAVGGLYNVWVDKSTGQVYPTFNVLTVEANPLMKRIHNSKERMPLIIPRAEEGVWLDEDLKGDTAAFLVQPYPADDIQARPVTKELHNPKVNADREESPAKFDYDHFAGLLP